MEVAVSKTDLARNTREIVDQVRHGQTVIVLSYGEEQVVLLDALDYRLLKAVVAYVAPQERDREDALADTIRLYLDEQISLAKAAENIGLSRFDLMERFERLGVPLRFGPNSTDEAHEEIRAAGKGKTLPS